MPAPQRSDRPSAHGVRSVVVVGAGLAGAQSVAALRAQGFEGRVTLLGAEGVAPYDRPPLSKHLFDRVEPAWLTGELGVDVAALADDVRLAHPATGLAVGPDGVTVATATGDLSADAVVIASGSRALRPVGWAGARTLQTADDAARLRVALTPGARLVIVGAGWIGAEVAGVTAAAGVEVTVVEATGAPLAVALGAAVGGLTAAWYRAAGVRLLTGVPAEAVRADGVRLEDGRELPADVVLVAVGSRPATAWLGSALPRDPDGALRVDERFAVLGAPGRVFAVGDVARRRSARHGWVPGGHWDGALRGPAIAVRALLGGPDAATDEDPAPYVFSTQLGHDLALFGQPNLTVDDLVLRGDPTGTSRTTGIPGTTGAPGDPGTTGAPGTPGTTGTSGWTALWFAPTRPGSPIPGRRELTGVLTVDRPRDTAAARRLFTGRTLSRLDPPTAADPTRPLRDAVG
ncbi:FAD-dependent oxidoreductase [Pengzhenrongella frigida]|uniref:FAD-dependent oxidoreductase n=1 Tax=Pengzhenrongella frigida TaxID=1259133 RepID=A0A4Q5N5Z1_9MICO|nr:FAD-dependent oxidoreductase [Cellulomonas sp. HLT2-17]RYV52237.1 FAD-dependent oxidoreductase [Cellulomonas sp. HLT2-17]